jgi:hypothetical protein
MNIRNEVARTLAWARYFARVGARPPIERATYKRRPNVPLTSAERLAAWRVKYSRVPLEISCGPVQRKWPGVMQERTAPAGL